MEEKMLTYQESVKTNLLGLIISIFIHLLGAFFLGYFYNALIIKIPLVYLNFLITFGLGLLLGYIIRITVRLSHNRNKRNQIIQAIVLGLLVNYFQWIAYLLFAYNDELPKFSEYAGHIFWIFHPSSFFELMAEVNKIGLWSIFGINLNGFILTLIWLVEALLIIGGPVFSVITTKIYPYSELLMKWYSKYTLLDEFASIYGETTLMKNLQTDCLKTIKELGKGTANRYSKIHLFYLPGEEHNYLTFEKINIESRGKARKTSKIILNNFRVDKDTANKILEQYGNKRERIEIL